MNRLTFSILVAAVSVGSSLAVAACSSNNSNSSGSNDAGSKKDGASGSSSGGSSGSSGSGSGSSGSSGSSSSSGSGASGGVCGYGAVWSSEGCDCTTLPCNLVADAESPICCPATNTCIPSDLMAGVQAGCPSPVWVECTTQRDCKAGSSCCVTAATTTGSGPSGGECFTGSTCDLNVNQGPACNTDVDGGGLADCPGPTGSYIQCNPVPNSPAGLGVCIPKFVSDAGKD